MEDTEVDTTEREKLRLNQRLMLMLSMEPMEDMVLATPDPFFQLCCSSYCCPSCCKLCCPSYCRYCYCCSSCCQLCCPSYCHWLCWYCQTRYFQLCRLWIWTSLLSYPHYFVKTKIKISLFHSIIVSS